MIGFIKKDIAMIKNNFKSLAILIIIYVVMGLFGEMDISFVLPFMAVMIMISTFSYDTYNKWDAYSVSLPNGRKNVVKSKYITTLLIILIVSIIITILSILIAYNKSKIVNYEEILLSMMGNIFATLLVLSLMYPTIYKFGIEKARIGIFIAVFGIVIIFGFISKFIDFSNFLSIFSFLENYWAITLLVVSIITVYISYIISLKIQLKKEF